MARDPYLHPLVQCLAEAGQLHCPACKRATLSGVDTAFVCSSCDTRFSTYNRVVDLHGLVNHTPSDVDVASALSLAEPITEELSLPASWQPRVREVLRRTAQMSAHHEEFDAEIRDVADRYGIEPPADYREPPPPPDPPAPRRLSLRVERHYIPSTLQPGEARTCNVRFRNESADSFSSTSDPPVTIGFRWFAPDGSLADVPERRTRFPIVMTPNRAITLPVEIVTPDAPGEYTLVVCAVIEGPCWVPECGLAAAVTVGATASPQSPLDLKPEAEALSYSDDHDAAREMLERTASELLATPGRRILEIGGGAAPQVSWFGAHDVVNVDINLPLLELGSLWYEHNAADAVSERLAFVCADATNLPFEPESFDIVTMFATLHHFPEPEALLRECRRLASPDGIVAVLCEPVGTTLESGDTLRDLKKGINEQVFTVDEYLAVFSAAGLEPVTGDQVGGSLRVFLRRADESGVQFTDVAAVAASLCDSPALRHAPPPAAPAPRSRLSPGRVWRGFKRRVRAL